MTSGLESLGRLRLQAILLLAAVFVIGALAGVALDRSVIPRGHPPGMDNHPPHLDGPPPSGLPPELTEGLDLTSEQERQISVILERSRPRIDDVLDHFLPRLRDITDSVRVEVRGVLTPGQQEIFDRREPPLFGKDGPPPPGGRPPWGEGSRRGPRG
jgi:hypothetical protein